MGIPASVWGPEKLCKSLFRIRNIEIVYSKKGMLARPGIPTCICAEFAATHRPNQPFEALMLGHGSRL